MATSIQTKMDEKAITPNHNDAIIFTNQPTEPINHLQSNIQLHQLFNNYLDSKPIIKDMSALTIAFTPSAIPHREKQIEDIGKALAPALKGFRPGNMFVYGKCGTGKSLVVNFVANELQKTARQKVKVVYVNCKMKKTADTEYRLLANIAEQLGRKVPDTGLPTDVVYRTVFETLDAEEQVLILIIDEIDTLIAKTGDEILYNLTRINQDLKKAKVCLIGITNELGFLEKLEPRVRSSLSEEEFVFPPYNALQLQDILRERAKVAFDADVLDAGVVEKAAALAAQEHGDARKALDLLRVAAELAERKGDKKITIAHVDSAQEKVDYDRVIETIKAQPKQSQLVLFAVTKLSEKESMVQTGDVFDTYEKLCQAYGLKPLTHRRVSDLIAELDMFGIIQTRVISKGRYGRTRTISLALDGKVKEKVMAILTEAF